MDNTKLYLFGIVQLRFLSMHSILYSIANPVTIKTYVLDKFEKAFIFNLHVIYVKYKIHICKVSSLNYYII